MKDDRSKVKTLLLWAVLIVGFIIVFNYVKQSGEEEEIALSQFLDEALTVEGLEDGKKPLSQVARLTVSGERIYGELYDGSKFHTQGDIKALGDDLMDVLRKGIGITYLDSEAPVEVSPESIELPFSAFIKKLESLPPDWEDGDYAVSPVKSVEVRGEEIIAKYEGEKQKKTSGKLSEEDEKKLRGLGVSVKHEPQTEGFWVQFLISWVPMIFLFLIFFFFIRQLQSGGGKAMSFGKSKHRLLTEASRQVTFDDIAGIEEAKAELREIVEFLKEPKKFTRLGGHIPKGVLLMGSPGTGKTLLARGVAGEAGVPFFSISGSDFVEMFVGVGASRVRDLFEQGKKNAPCLIFIDEIDAVGRHRGAGLGGGHDEREQTLNQLLVEMDGFESNEGVILISATNRPDVLDPALLRPGRFDRRVVVPLPDLLGRVGILKVHTSTKPLADDVELEHIARGTPGFSGADLENLVNEAALLAARGDNDAIHQRHLEEAKDKVMMGTERKSMVLSPEEKKTTAYHEIGHALVARLLKHADPLYKVTIIPRGMAMGVTQLLPEKDRHGYTKNWVLDTMAMLMAGRVAEELVFSEQTTGAGHDIVQCTNLARKMVTEWGMSNLGPIAYDTKQEEVFLGRDFARQQAYSESVAQRIDREVKRLVNEAYDVALRILKERRDVLEEMAQLLLTKETLTRTDVEGVLAKYGIPPREGDQWSGSDDKEHAVEESEPEVTPDPEEKVVEPVASPPPLGPRHPVEQS
jgi:cell division protease FtsH